MHAPSENPYLRPRRLSDVIAAIQVMAVNELYQAEIFVWLHRMGLNEDDHERHKYWTQVLSEHPEFFRQDPQSPQRFSLILRRSMRRRYHIPVGRMISDGEFDGLNVEQREREVTRPPLSELQVEMLVDTAITLHRDAVDERRDRRWWISSLQSFFGVLVGAITTYLTIKFGK